MSKIFKIIFFILLGILVVVFVIQKLPLTKWQKVQIFKPNLTSEAKILESLTLEQKIGQLLLIGFEGKNLTPQLENLIKTIHPGGVVLLSRNISDENQLKKLIEDIQKISLDDIGLPIFVAVDQEGEPISRIQFLSEKTSQSEIKNIGQAYEIGLRRGNELKSLGVNLNLAPVLDIVQPNDFLYNRSFQKNPEKTGELAKALISGQKAAGIITTVKHFPGYGGITFNPERVKLPVLSKIPEISQFKKALEAQPELVMTANVIYTEIDKKFPFTLSPQGIQFLKTELNAVRDYRNWEETQKEQISNGVKNDFLIISDDLSSPVLKKEFSLKETIILAAKAGVDILIVAGFDEPKDPLYAFNFLLEAVKNNEISEARINQSVLAIIKLKQTLLQ